MRLQAVLYKGVGILLAFMFPPGAIASDHDFDAAVASIEHSYHLHRQHIPMMGIASVCARVASGGAVKGLQIAAFDGGARLPEGSDMPALLKQTLGASWSLMAEHRSSVEQDAVYMRPKGRRMLLLVANYDDGDLSVVRLNLDAAHFANWANDPASHLQARSPE